MISCRTIVCLLLLLTGLLSPLVEAGQERYEYDALGRLVRVIDAQGRVTEYVYDAVGNLLHVIPGATSQAPTVTTVTPNTLRRGATAQVQVAGTGLNNVTVATSAAGVSISTVSVTPTVVSFSLAVSATATLGPQSILLTNSIGSTTATITVNPSLPTVLVSPAPLAIPPDNVQRQFTIRLSNTDTIAHAIALSVTNALVATVSPLTVTILAGQTEVQASVTGKAAGQTIITLTSSTLGTTSVPVFVTTEFTGINTSVSPLLGVIVQPTVQPPASTTITPLLSRAVGVAFGSYIQGLNPKAITIGAGPTPIVISGSGFSASSTVAVTPPDGLTLGAVTVSPDGQAITVPVTVAANAPTTTRQVVVTAGTVRYVPASPDADRLLISFPAPVVESVTPLFATPGTTLGIALRGRNFQNTQSISFSPSAGIIVGSSPSISGDGTAMSLSIALAPTVALGAKTVTVTTSGGTSDSAPSAFNTFTLVNEVRESLTPISSAAVGVVKQEVVTPPSQSVGLFSSSVGVMLGGSLTDLTPVAKPIGESFTLTVNGFELQAVTDVQFSPNTGVTVGALTIASDGRSFTAPVTLAADAPQTLRTVTVLAGTTTLRFSDLSRALFRVTAPQPVIDSISPIVLHIGGPLTTLTVRGQNFQNATQVQVAPSMGLTISSPPSVSADGTSLSVTISAAVGSLAGDRAVVVVTPAGQTTSTLSPANSIKLSPTAGDTFPSLASAPVGVVKNDVVVPPPPTAIGPVSAPLVGVLLESTSTPVSTTTFLPATVVGVTLGSVPTAISPTGIIRGASGVLTVTGFALNGVTSLSVNPSTGITLGSVTVSPDGLQVTAPMTVATDAPLGAREIVVSTSASRVLFPAPQAGLLRIGAGVPLMDSITPILASQGQKVSMTVRGASFQGAFAVTATPAAGITFGPIQSIDAAGTIITIEFAIAPDAPLGARVIQVVVPGAISTADPVPANTFTVFPP